MNRYLLLILFRSEICLTYFWGNTEKINYVSLNYLGWPDFVVIRALSYLPQIKKKEPNYINICK